MASNADLYNRQLHPDERKWAKENAKEFAAFYEGKTGLAITVEQAENMLLANGYRLVDAYASKGPGGDRDAIQYISEKGGGLFVKDQYYSDPFKFGNKDGLLMPEQIALNTGRPTPPPLNYTVSAGIYAGVGAEAEIGFTGLIPVNARLAFGGGIGAHGWIQGASQGGSVDVFSYGQSPNSGDYRIGSSAGGSPILGPVAGQINASAGMSPILLAHRQQELTGKPREGLAFRRALVLARKPKLISLSSATSGNDGNGRSTR